MPWRYRSATLVWYEDAESVYFSDFSFVWAADLKNTFE